MNATKGGPLYTRLTQGQLDAICEKHDRLRAGKPGGARAVFSWCDLSGLSLWGRVLNDADFCAAILKDCDLRGAALDFSNFYCVDLQSADLSMASLRRADLRGACLRGANLSNCDLYEADLREGAMALPDRARGLTYFEINMRNAAADQANLRGANLDRSKLGGLQATKADFTDATMRGCSLVRANLRQCIMDNVDLGGADLSGADLSGASLKDAVLIGAKTDLWRIHRTNLSGVLTDKSVGIDVLSLPYVKMLDEHAIWVASVGTRGRALNFDGADMRGLKILKGQNFSAISANRAIFYGMDMRGIQLQGAYLEGADLRNCDLRGADLRGARLGNARLDNANLAQAQLGALSFDDGRELPVDLRHARLCNADLEGADLRRARLDGADFARANIERAKISLEALAHVPSALVRGKVAMVNSDPERLPA